MKIIERVIMMPKKIIRAKKESVSILSFMILFIVFAVILKNSWIQNIPTMLRDISWLGIVAIGQTVLLISGEFDLSVGSAYAFVGMCFVLFLQAGVGVIPAFIFAILISIIIGLINSLITLRFKIPSLLVTLGFLFIYRGAAYLISGGFNVVFPESIRGGSFVTFLGGKPLGFHSSILLFALIGVALALILSWTRFGNQLFAVGGDPATAASCGVSPNRTKTIAFIVCSSLTGLAGIIAACTFSGVGPTFGTGLEFETIAAAVIGGALLSGGVGSIVGTILGASTLLALKSGLILMGVNIFVYQIVLGPLVIAAVAIKEAIPRLFRK